jgi:hypothetical protein
MIARFRLFLDFPVYVEDGSVFSTYTFERQCYGVRVLPLSQAKADPSELEYSAEVWKQVVAALEPCDHPRYSEAIAINGRPSYKANLLTIDFVKKEFERGRPKEMKDVYGDPTETLAFDVANEVIRTLRVLSRGPTMKAITPQSSFWRLDYLDDSEHELPRDESKVRQRHGSRFKFEISAMTPDLWRRMIDAEMTIGSHIWDALLLDAEALLTEIGPAIAVANTALEIFIPWALNQLVAFKSTSDSAPPTAQGATDRAAFTPELWEWPFNRGDWYQNPSVEDQYSVLLKALTGRSLKDNGNLWEGLTRLRRARNSFSHGGLPAIDRSRKIAVTKDEVTKLIDMAKSIINWVEELLPEPCRRPKFVPGHQVELPLPDFGPPA